MSWENELTTLSWKMIGGSGGYDLDLRHWYAEAFLEAGKGNWYGKVIYGKLTWENGDWGHDM